jgi:hypothetical protein
MQAIEFETRLKNGVIQLPSSYQHWQEGRRVKVIVLVDEGMAETTPDMVTAGKDLNHHAGKLTLTEDPLVFQESMRNEWT